MLYSSDVTIDTGRGTLTAVVPPGGYGALLLDGDNVCAFTAPPAITL